MEDIQKYSFKTFMNFSLSEISIYHNNKIGNTTYDVSFHYSRQSRESMNDKIIRLIENDMQGMKNN